MAELIPIESVLDLQLHVHVIGYHPEGECILIIIYDAYSNSVKKSILIDCYDKGKDQRQVRKLLKEKGISLENPSNLIIWTHPDSDHSEGIRDIIANYTNEDTIVVIPDGINKWTLLLKGQLLNYNYLLDRFKAKRIKLDRINTSNNRDGIQPYLSCVFDDSGRDPISFYIEVLTPFTNDVFEETELKKIFKKNNVSISAILHFGDLHLYFGGDVEDNAINQVPIYKFKDISFIKIPHHGSNTSTALPQRILTYLEEDEECGQGQITSVSTSCYRGKNSLPKIEVLELYKPISKKICLTDSEETRVNLYGIWTYEYEIIKNKMIDKKEGDAMVWYEG